MSNARNIASIAGADVLNASNEIVPVYACRAWVNFNGTLDENQLSLTTGENVYIRDAGNVSSVYYNGTGSYTVNFEIPMPDANYVVTWEADQVMPYVPNAQSSTSASVVSRNGSNLNVNCSFGVVAIFR